MFSQPGTERSGTPSRTVAIAFAWTSAPGISSPPYGVCLTSWRTGEVAPTTTILPLSRSGLTLP